MVIPESAFSRQRLPGLRPVWVTGAGGLIGSHIVRVAPQYAPQFEVIALTRPALDLADFGAVEGKFRQDRPQLIVHCAAMSRSAGCQADPVLAKKINTGVTAHLAALAADIDFIFFSTDLVFDGRQGDYVESDLPNPLSVYGETKAAAEQSVLKNGRHTVLRAALNYGFSPGGHQSFNEELQAAWRAGKSVKLFFDEFRCVIPAAITARAVWDVASNGAGGIYHLAGSERLSRLQIGRWVAARCPELDPRIESCSLRDYHGPPRPADVSLNCGKIQRLLSFRLPAFSQWQGDENWFFRKVGVWDGDFVA
jgi:dTDP-4-dehydrorhamnose reductase